MPNLTERHRLRSEFVPSRGFAEWRYEEQLVEEHYLYKINPINIRYRYGCGFEVLWRHPSAGDVVVAAIPSRQVLN